MMKAIGLTLAAATLLCSLPVTLRSQEPWSLKDCTDYALEHNLSVKSGAITVEQRETELNTSKGRRLPAVSASASENVSFGRGLTADNTYSNTNTTSTSFSLGADLPIFRGFDINNEIKISGLNLKAATADLEKARDDIRVAVAQAYVQILYKQELLSVARQQASHDSLLLAQVQGRRESGKASSADEAAQAALLSQSRLSAIQAEGELRLAILDLTQLLELPSPDGFSIVRPDDGKAETALLMLPEAIYEEAVGIKPAVESARIATESAKVAVDRAKGAYLPSLSLTGGIGTNFYTAAGKRFADFGEQLRNNFSQYVGLTLSVPIFQRFSARNQVKQAKLSLEQSEIQYESAKKSLYKEIQQAYYNAVASQARLEGSRSSEESARLHYSLTEEKYKVGKAGITDYSDARTGWLKAQSELIRARFECLYQTGLLDFYRGVPIGF